MKIYITSESAITALNGDISKWETNPLEKENVLSCIEPNYAEFLDPRATRRMSRMMKMGMTAALMCLQKSNVNIPDAIITATGLGCLADTDAFLSKLSHGEGQVLNPTPFIQSTHNTVSGAIALHLQCHNYNNTFTQRGFSFESALTEASLLLNEYPNQNILVGALDETIHRVNQIIQQLRDLKTSNHKMVPVGEGFSFFLLSGIPVADALTLSCFKTFYNTPAEQLHAAYSEIVSQEAIPDLILLGTNGNEKNDRQYDWISSLKIPVLNYKKYCGEYPTAPAFAHWMACNILRKGHSGMNNPKKILIYNHSEGRNHSFTFIEK